MRWDVQGKNGIVVELKKWVVNGCYYDDSEIEKAKDDFRFFNTGDYITKEMSNSKDKIFEYIEQLESDEQKLIEKLEKYTNNTKKEKLPYFKTVADMIKYKGYAEGKLKACEEILSIIKGEKYG